MDVRRATLKDFKKMSRFLDEHLRRDWFDTKKRLINFIKNYDCRIAVENDEIIALSVTEKTGVMIRLLVRPDYRGKGIGAKLVEQSEPQIIRSKTDQSTGDPSAFYEKLGYRSVGKKVGRKKNIQLMIRSESAA